MAPADDNIDINKVFTAESKVSIDEGDRLRFAKQVLGCLALICVSVFIAYSLRPDNSALQSIFELIKIGALPLVTLVVSFYFPNATS